MTRTQLIAARNSSEQVLATYISASTLALESFRNTLREEVSYQLNIHQPLLDELPESPVIGFEFVPVVNIDSNGVLTASIDAHPDGTRYVFSRFSAEPGINSTDEEIESPSRSVTFTGIFTQPVNVKVQILNEGGSAFTAAVTAYPPVTPDPTTTPPPVVE